jgi:hypothetical protein
MLHHHNTKYFCWKQKLQSYHIPDSMAVQKWEEDGEPTIHTFDYILLHKTSV